MKTENPNPFVLPGFGQSGDAAQNPVFAGMEMMRKAWQGMAGAGVSGLESAGMPIMSMEDLERRISELQAVESWLRLNLSMLSNTIQGMEIQRSTMATLRSFASQGMPEGFGAQSGQPAKGSDKSGASSNASADKAREAQPYVQAAEDWWHLVQDQFQSLAAATAATLQTAQQGVAAVTGADGGIAPTKKRAATSAKSATKSTKSTTQARAQPAGKSAAKSVRKTTAKRSTRSG